LSELTMSRPKLLATSTTFPQLTDPGCTLHPKKNVPGIDARRGYGLSACIDLRRGD